MSSSQYNHNYTAPGGATCLDQAAIGGFGAAIVGSPGGPLGMAATGGTSFAISAAVCKMYD
jgi:hypothetical protein